MPKTKEEVDKKISDMIAEFSGLINEEGARVIIEKELGRNYFHPFYPSISSEFFKSIREKNMSQLPKITIADLLSQTRVGMLEARITEVSVFPVVSKYANPPNSTVNVYKLKLLDNSGTIEYSDWCKKPLITRSYKVGHIIRFHHAKLKISTNIDPTTGIVYPPTLTVEKSTIIELLNSNGDAIIPKTIAATSPVAQPVQAVSLPSVASFPVPHPAVAPQAVGPEWMIVKAQYPTFYNAVDVLFGEIFKQIPEAQQKIAEIQYSGLMDIIWGKQ